jgi:hypothetical protein
VHVQTPPTHWKPGQQSSAVAHVVDAVEHRAQNPPRHTAPSQHSGKPSPQTPSSATHAEAHTPASHLSPEQQSVS